MFVSIQSASCGASAWYFTVTAAKRRSASFRVGALNTSRRSAATEERILIFGTCCCHYFDSKVRLTCHM